ncbi:MAG: hypothetical protein HY690_02750 [Chloroflexi bacterium]|nr:hypothetical protein [Chloroflexota bacterium]
MPEPVIVGIGETRVGELPGSTSVELQAEAVRLAVQDAGLEKGDLDGLLTCPPYSTAHSMLGLQVSEYLGLRPRVAATIDVGGTPSILTMLETAVSLVRDHRCTAVVCVFGENQRTSRPRGVRGTVRAATVRGGEAWEEPFGVSGMAIAYALLMRRYMYRYGATREQFGAVAIAARKHALLNPNAQLRAPLSMDEYLASPMVASPICRRDCSLVSDGAGAVVVTSRAYATGRALARRAVAVLGHGSRVSHRSINQLPDVDELPLASAAAEAYARAGLSARDLHFAQIHDAFTISTLLGVEGLGLCAVGEGGRYAAEGLIELGSPVPINTHGGHLAQAHIGGMLHVVETVRQLRGEAGARQVPGARVGAVLGNGGVESAASCTLLGEA